MKTGIRKAGLTALAMLCMTHIHAHADQQPIEDFSRAEVIHEQRLSNNQKESDHDFKCGAEGSGTTGYVIVGRKHSGDENGDTNYRCGKVIQFKVLDPPGEHQVLSNEPDDGNYVVCPENKVLTGRKHQGDENATEYFTCSSLKDIWGNIMQVVPQPNWSQNFDEDSHDFTCDENTVMIGKYHKGDENGDTSYLCGTLW